ncbi:MAG: MBL fold metallo-hydrolase [Clostridia bacterium]|nr:MBL fold metallo-hydrolase [Clostridia bacterium]
MMIMNPCHTKKIVENIYSIKTSIVNMYLYQYADKYIAIDCGSNLEKVKENLLLLNINASDVTHIFLTHSDYDHVAGLPLFTNARVYLGHEELQMIDKTTPRFSAFKFNKPLGCSEFELLLDQQEIEIENVNIRCFATPGHTPGSMSYLFDQKYFFVGDAVSIKNGEIKPFFKFFVMDMKTHLKSITKIENVRKAQIVFSGHHGYKIK